MTTSKEQRAVDVAAYAFLRYVHDPNSSSATLFRERIADAIQTKGTFAGRHVETLELREILCAISERALVIFKSELIDAVAHGSPELATAIEDDLSRTLRKLVSLIGELTPTTH